MLYRKATHGIQHNVNKTKQCGQRKKLFKEWDIFKVQISSTLHELSVKGVNVFCNVEFMLLYDVFASGKST